MNSRTLTRNRLATCRPTGLGDPSKICFLYCVFLFTMQTLLKSYEGCPCGSKKGECGKARLQVLSRGFRGLSFREGANSRIAPLEGEVAPHAHLHALRVRMPVKGERIVNRDRSLFPGLEGCGNLLPNPEVALHVPRIPELHIIDYLVELPVPGAGEDFRLGRILLARNNRIREW